MRIKIYLLMFATACSLHGMDQLPIVCKSFDFSDIIQVRCVRDGIVVIQNCTDAHGDNRKKILIYDHSTENITSLHEKSNQWMRLLCVNSQQTKAVFNIRGTSCEKIMLYDLETKEKKLIDVPAYSLYGACYDDKAKNILLYCQSGKRIAYRVTSEECRSDKQFLQFLTDDKKSIYHYDPKDGTVLSYHDKQEAFYYGPVENWGALSYLMPCDFTKYSMIQYAINIPLFVFSRIRMSDGYSELIVLNMIDKTHVIIDGSFNCLLSMSIHPAKKILATLSSDGYLNYIDIAQKKYVYEPAKMFEDQQRFSREQKAERKLLSFSRDGKSLVIALPKNLVILDVPSNIVYDDEDLKKWLVPIIFSLKNVGTWLPKEIIQLLTLKTADVFLLQCE